MPAALASDLSPSVPKTVSGPYRGLHDQLGDAGLPPAVVNFRLPLDALVHQEVSNGQEVVEHGTRPGIRGMHLLHCIPGVLVLMGSQVGQFVGDLVGDVGKPVGFSRSEVPLSGMGLDFTKNEPSSQ